MISEFFTRQVVRLASGAPEALDRNYRVFQQRIKERLGAQWAHVTAQPEVDDAVRQVTEMNDFFTRLEKMVDRQRVAMQKINDIDIEMYLFYQQQCFSESFESIRKPMMQLSLSYKAITEERQPVIQSYEQYYEFLRTFREKAIGDALETMKKQQVSRLELDSYGSRLGQLEEKKLKAFAKSPGTFSLGGDSASATERELDTTRQRFQESKNRYQSLSTQMIDKAGLLHMKRDVDFSAHIRAVVAAHEWYCRGFRTPGLPIPDEDVQDGPSPNSKGFGSSTYRPPQDLREALAKQLRAVGAFCSSWHGATASVVLRFRDVVSGTRGAPVWALAAPHDLHNGPLLRDRMAAAMRLVQANTALCKSIVHEFNCLLPPAAAAHALVWGDLAQAHQFLADAAPFDDLIADFDAACADYSPELTDGSDVEQRLAEAIRADDAARLTAALDASPKGSVPPPQVLLAAVRTAPTCAAALTASGVDLATALAGDVLGGNILHLLAGALSLGSQSSESALATVKALLASGASSLNAALAARNAYGRTPLHLAAADGNLEIVQALLADKLAAPSAATADLFGHTPLMLAVLNGHAHLVDDLVKYSPADPAALSRALHLACEADAALVVQALIRVGAHATAKTAHGDSIAHIAGRTGHSAIVQELLKLQDLDWNARNAAGQTPLIVAAMCGHFDAVAEMLLSHRTSSNERDRAGLTAQDHAVLRGEMAIADLLAQYAAPAPAEPAVPLPDAERIIDLPIGQPVLQNEALVQVYLGTLDSRAERPPLDIDDAHSAALQSCGALVLHVWAQSESSASPTSHTLPLPDQHSLPRPLVFRVADPDDVVLHFEIWPSHELKARVRGTLPLAAAHVALAAPKTPLWLEDSRMCGRVVLPVITHPRPASDRVTTIGSLTVEIVVATPFATPGSAAWHAMADAPAPGSRSDSRPRWASKGTVIVGHRGLGANRPPVNGASYLQLGENTVLSLTKAGELGAAYVEFDVQLTKDLVPVIYHNFVMTEAGVDVPVNAVPLSKFLTMHPKVKHPIVRSQSPDGRRRPTPGPLVAPGSKMKPNGEGSVQGPFPTLEEAFNSVPVSTGFNIEIKYPTVQEAEMLGLRHADINLFCDQVLDVVFDHADSSRKLYFSSFHPEMCLLLAQKQNAYPVFFLTDGGMHQACDERLNSLWNAIMVAKASGCLGIVTVVDPLLKAPRIITAIRRTGLVLFTYGSASNFVANCKIQRAYGVDGIIVDKVRHIVVGMQ
ncbi:Glycerophosphocholine phosphodiesterase [Polyrhizophydium stewartii]|uniref:Glycerophosphocholine phosphodiesterase n=1 Tax=Polyrhizophydium stewartii TaxID=2732419 RepID=A0ABR4NF62_9FUNG